MNRMQSMESLVEYLELEGAIKSQRVENVMKQVDRKLFAPSGSYMDMPEPISNEATISAPHMHAFALESVKDALPTDREHQKKIKVLDIGSGSGYLCACFSAMLGHNGVVVGVEHDPSLNAQAEANINRYNRELLPAGKIKIFTADGRLGFPLEAPYDAIHIGAACLESPRRMAEEQLKPGGILVAPVERGFYQEMVIYKKGADSTVTENNTGIPVMYVPLTNPPI